MARLTLVLGGVRSGKSRFAEVLARASQRVVYLATARPDDAEMAERIAVHRRRRERQAPAWRTVEEPWDVPAALTAALAADPGPEACVLLECLSLWLTNLLVGLPARPALDDAAVAGRLDALLEAARAGSGRVVVVSSEVGCGLLPPNALARRFGDLLGEANQRLAAAADEVHACVAGIPVPLKVTR
jgi:adenosylcobinamide kinase/adenosylcobinamide-phosphate guanylyltransferase